MIRKLKSLSKRTTVTDINLTVNGEKVKFNLHNELHIDTKGINEELMNQPNHFAYLSLLLVKVKQIKDTKAMELQTVRDSIFIDFKEDTDNMTGRQYSNDLAEAYISQQDDYIDKNKEYIKAEHDYNIIKVCVDSFQQRKDLLQSLSANIRQEKNVI